jgi:hypothetical protein
MALLALVVTLVGCGDDDGETTSASEASSTGPRTDAPHLQGPGTEIADGLVVPDGAALAGTTFRWRDRYDRGGEPAIDEHESWTALLLVEDDPFAVFDDLAAQVRELGPEMPGTAAACLWTAPAEGDDLDRQERPVDWGPPPFDVEGLICEASAGDPKQSVSLDLVWGPGSSGVVRIGGSGPGMGTHGAANWPPDDWESNEEAIVPGAGSGSGVDCEALASTEPCEPAEPTAPTTMQPRDTLPVLTADPVPDEARDLLPAPAAAMTVSPGEPFGGTGNCFLEGYRQFDLPPGAVLVATEGGSDGTSVLAVDDAAAVMAALAAQSDPSGADVVEGTVPLLDGTEVARTGISISAGGGGCDLTASPDGQYLLITMHSD